MRGYTANILYSVAAASSQSHPKLSETRRRGPVTRERLVITRSLHNDRSIIIDPASTARHHHLHHLQPTRPACPPPNCNALPALLAAMFVRI